MSKEQEDTIRELADEGRALISALNSLTGYSHENPNPLVKRMLRLIGDAEVKMETEDE
jgi:hypothetical protein